MNGNLLQPSMTKIQTERSSTSEWRRKQSNTFDDWNSNHWIKIFQRITAKLSNRFPAKNTLIRGDQKISRKGFFSHQPIIHQCQTTDPSKNDILAKLTTQRKRYMNKHLLSNSTNPYKQNGRTSQDSAQLTTKCYLSNSPLHSTH